jgi:hypothetical protein
MPVRFHFCASVLLVCGLAACSGKDDAPPVATPSFSANKDRLALGGPVDLTFRFDVAAAIKDDYKVLVHVVNTEGDTIWNDDHDPAVPTSQWKPGQKIQYTVTHFVPIVPYTGEATVRVGLYRGSERLPLQGVEPNQRTYKVGTVQLLPQSENIFIIYKNGWHAPEFNTDTLGEWQWTQKSATVNFKNPRKDITLFLEFDARPDLFKPPQQVSIVVGGKAIRSFVADRGDRSLQRIPISAAELGGDEMVEMRLDVDRSFVPKLLPNMGSDSRELGIRVYRLFVEPR